MTRPYYAPITSSLLVRKGEARPWVSSAEAKVDTNYTAPRMPVFAAVPAAPRPETPVAPPAPQIATPQIETPEISAPAPVPAPSITMPQNDDHVRRCTIKLSQNEFERLGIIAVKKEISRQQVLHQAIDLYLRTMREEYRSLCGCLGGVCKGEC